MKKLLSTLFAIALGLNLSAQVPDYVPTDGLVAWYPFNGNANDESGNGNDGENEGAILHENRFFESASAYFFSESDFISLPSIAVSTSFSASFWISPVEGSAGSDAILDGGQGKFIRIMPSLVSENWRFGYNSECIGNPIATSEFSLNSWVHGAITFDDDSLHFFQNGVKHNSIEHCASDWSFQLIGFADNGEHGFDGVIDDLGIWGRTLTEGEILALYNAQLPVPGCTDVSACNFSSEANEDDGSCIYPLFGDDCEDGGAACGEGTIWDVNIQACVVSDFCQEDLDGDGVIGVNDLMQLLSFFGTACEAEDVDPELGEFTCGDPINYHGYDYATVQIGEQCWFAENLRSENYQNGDDIPSNLSDSQWSSTSEGAAAVFGEGGSTCYDFSPDGDACDALWSLIEYGRLYNWYAVDDSRGLCPSGWDVPTDGEWMTMEMALGMSEAQANQTDFRGTDQGTQMKTTYGWNNGGSGTNSSGFSGLPGGNRNYPLGYFDSTGSFEGWWSSSPHGSDAWYRYLLYTDEGVSRADLPQQFGFSVRCLKDSEE